MNNLLNTNFSFSKNNSGVSPKPIQQLDNIKYGTIEEWLSLYPVTCDRDILELSPTMFTRRQADVAFGHANFHILDQRLPYPDGDLSYMIDCFETGMDYETFIGYEIKKPVIPLRKLFDAMIYIREEENKETYINEYGVLIDLQGSVLDMFDEVQLENYFGSKKKEYRYNEVAESVKQNALIAALSSSTNYHKKLGGFQQNVFTQEFLKLKSRIEKISDQAEKRQMALAAANGNIQIVKDNFLFTAATMNDLHARGRSIHQNSKGKVQVSNLDAILGEFSLVTSTIMNKEKVKETYYAQLVNRYGQEGVMVFGKSTNPKIKHYISETIIGYTEKIDSMKRRMVYAIDLDILPTYNSDDLKDGSQSYLYDILCIMDAAYKKESGIVLIVNMASQQTKSCLRVGLVPKEQGWLSLDCRLRFFVPELCDPEPKGLFTRQLYVDKAREWREYKTKQIKTLSDASKGKITILRQYLAELGGSVKLKVKAAEPKPADVTDQIPDSQRGQFSFSKNSGSYESPLQNAGNYSDNYYEEEGEDESLEEDDSQETPQKQEGNLFTGDLFANKKSKGSWNNTPKQQQRKGTTLGGKPKPNVKQKKKRNTRSRNQRGRGNRGRGGQRQRRQIWNQKNNSGRNSLSNRLNN